MSQSLLASRTASPAILEQHRRLIQTLPFGDEHGDASALSRLLAVLDSSDPDFAIVTP